MEHAVNALNRKKFDLPEGAPFRSVVLRSGSEKEGAGILGATVFIDTARSEPDFKVAFTRGKSVSLFVMNRDNQKAMLWTSGQGLSWKYDFYEMPSYRVDMQSMNKRAIRDARQSLSRDKTFPVAETPESGAPKTELSSDNQEVAARGATASPVTDRMSENALMTSMMTVTADNVNVRSLPSKNGSVRKLLARGATVVVTGMKNGWCEIDVDGRKGYVADRFLSSSLAGPAASASPEAVAVAEPSSTITTVAAVNTSTIATVAEAVTPDAAGGAPSLSNNSPGAAQAFTGSGMKRTIRYQGTGRDPFLPLVSSSVSKDGLPRIENLSLVGILYDDADRIALCEDRINGNQPFSFRESDPVDKGKILKIYRDKVVFLITEFGVSRSFTLEIANATQDKEAGTR
jgi:uncharacterized protein YraI